MGKKFWSLHMPTFFLNGFRDFVCAKREFINSRNFLKNILIEQLIKKPRMLSTIGSQFLLNLLLFRSPTKLKCKQKQPCGWSRSQQLQNYKQRKTIWSWSVVWKEFVSKFRWVFFYKELKLLLKAKWPWIIMVRYIYLTCLLNGRPHKC